MDNYLQTLLDNFGKALQNEPVVAEYTEARKAYVEDTEITAAVNEYNVQRMLLDEQQLKEDRDETLINSIQSRVNALYDKIMASEKMKTLAVAENRLNELLGEINKALMSYVVPDSGDGGCTGDCHSCHGCH